MSELDFHRAFEGRRRGMRESIGNRLEAYLPFLAPLHGVQPAGTAVDIGSGDVEWLELLQRQGLRVQGVDQRGNMLAAFAALPDASKAVVSALHVGDIDFAELQTLLSQALRVLGPGGLLILETTDGGRDDVGTTPPVRSASPALLALLCGYHGFARAGVLQRPQRAARGGPQTVGLTGALRDAGNGRGVVAQKAAAPDILHAFDAPFATLQAVEPDPSASRDDAGQARAADIQRARLEMRIREAEAARETLRTQLEARVAAAEAARDAALQSWSWRVTAPLRMATAPFLLPTSPLRRGASAAFARSAALCRRLLAAAMSQVLRRPQLSERINGWLLAYFPKLHGRLVEIAASGGGVKRNRDDAEHAAGSQAAHHGFAEFVAGFLEMPGGELLPPTLRRLGRFNGSRPEERVSRFAGIHLDHALIHAVQVANVVQSRRYDGSADADAARQLIRHIYLALLRRYPTRADEDRYLARLANGEPIQALIAGIRKSPDHQSIVRWA